MENEDDEHHGLEAVDASPTLKSVQQDGVRQTGFKAIMLMDEVF